MLYHPVTTELPLLRTHVAQLVEGLEALSLNYVIIYPNNDSGSEIILDGLTRFSARPSVRPFRRLRYVYFSRCSSARDRRQLECRDS